MEDKRFAHLKTDPKFRNIPKSARKVKIDKRFHSMFKDKKFKVKYTMDKRGRPVNHTSTEDLKRYYDLSSGESSPEEEPNEIEKPDKVETTSDLNVNEMTFDDEPKEACDRLPEKNKYEPRLFTTTALQQVKDDLTWEAPDPNRVELFQTLNSEKDFQKYFAVYDGESEEGDEEVEKDDDNEDEENSINKYKLLLQELEKKEKEKEDGEIDMEVSWAIDLKDKTKELVKKTMRNEERTPFQKYLDKRKEKRKEKKQQRKEEENDSDCHQTSKNLDKHKDKRKGKKKQRKEEENDSDDHKQTSKKKKKKNEENHQETNQELELLLTEDNKVDEFEVNVNDERFSALFTSHLYNIDPTSSQYKKTKAMETLISEKIKRRRDEPEVKEIRKDAELSVLVKSVKRKVKLLRVFPNSSIQ